MPAKPISAAALAFLRQLASWDGIAALSELDRTNGGGRRECSRRGLASFSPDGYWRLTEDGRAALKEAP